MLSRLPRSAARDRLIGKILEAAPRPSTAIPDVSSVLAPESTENEQNYLPLVEDAANRRICLEFKYFTTSRGDLRWRRASVQRVLIGPPARFVAVCHLDGSLKWFRLDNVHNACLDRSQPFRSAEAGEVEAMLNESVDGYHKGGPVQCSFSVREPDSRWSSTTSPSR
jgi:predicted DNA-binding transcriptional regulator YafY